MLAPLTPLKLYCIYDNIISEKEEQKNRIFNKNQKLEFDILKTSLKGYAKEGNIV